MSFPLAIQSLRHYSDFDETSESGTSEISYVRPIGCSKRLARKNGNKNNSANDGSSRCVVKRGARVTRRHENDLFLHSLSAISEADVDDECFGPWSDDIDSAFIQLVDDAELRAAWDSFIALSEIDQNRLLKAWRSDRRWRQSGSDLDLSTDSSDELSSSSPIQSPGRFSQHPSAANRSGHTRRRKTRKTSDSTNQPSALQLLQETGEEAVAFSLPSSYSSRINDRLLRVNMKPGASAFNPPVYTLVDQLRCSLARKLKTS